ncbi:MAG: hypothetical protein ACXWQ5_23320 [Ktedonobacterales bacterium]
MRYFPHMPPILRVATILGVLSLLTALALLQFPLLVKLPFFPWRSVDASRVESIALNLIVLGLGSTSVLATYNIRFLQPDRRPFPLSSWQSQLRGIALVAVLPICGIVLALFIPPTSVAFAIVFLVTLSGFLMLFASWLPIIRVR